jgi:hypothetical protein
MNTPPAVSVQRCGASAQAGKLLDMAGRESGATSRVKMLLVSASQVFDCEWCPQIVTLPNSTRQIIS